MGQPWGPAYLEMRPCFSKVPRASKLRLNDSTQKGKRGPCAFAKRGGNSDDGQGGRNAPPRSDRGQSKSAGNDVKPGNCLGNSLGGQGCRHALDKSRSESLQIILAGTPED